jgi:hypothetical protein
MPPGILGRPLDLVVCSGMRLLDRVSDRRSQQAVAGMLGVQIDEAFVPIADQNDLGDIRGGGVTRTAVCAAGLQPFRKRQCLLQSYKTPWWV